MKIKKTTRFLICFIAVLSIVNFNLAEIKAANLGDAWKNVDTAAGNQGAGFNTSQNDLYGFIGKVVQAALAFLGLIFLVLMIYAGYMWMTARGNEEQVKKATGTMTAAIIGTVIVVAAYAISWYIVNKLSTGTISPNI